METKNTLFRDMNEYPAEFYRALFDSLDNNTVLRRKTPEGVYLPISCSREFADMMECTPEEFIAAEQADPLSTVYEQDREEAAWLLDHGESRDGSNHIIVRKQTMKGNLIWVDLHYSFFRHDGQQYAYCSYFDVTPLKENERRIQMKYDELNQELRSISNDSLATIRSDLSGGVVEEIHGRDLYDVDRIGERMEVLLNRRLENMPNPADRARYLDRFTIDHMMEAWRRGEMIEPLVIFTRRQSGRQCFVQYSAAISRDPLSGNLSIFGIEREYNAEKVSEVLNQNILAKQYDMISYIVGGSYGVVIGDAASIKRGSIFPKERNGDYMTYIREQVLPAADSKQHDAASLLQAFAPETIRAELRDHPSYNIDLACVIDDEQYYKRFTFYEVDRDAHFYILLKSDYTEVQKEHIARNEQLKNALEEARQANIAKTAFLSNMSHEIRTPMNAIIGLNNIALSEPDVPAAVRGHLEQIGSSARHLLELINDILDMSRIESGKMVLKNEEFSLGSILEQINTMISGQCRDKGLSYECRVINGSIDSYYVGDDTKLKRVLINILGNAVKFTPAPGTVTFLVERTEHFGNQSTLRFIIRDTGIGMDAAYLPKLFDTFSQENESNTSQYGGSGLGMAITKNIIELMNGSISVTSEKGAGSEFVVEVTLSDSGRSAVFTEDIRPQDMEVLVIDDDPIACEHARLVLEEVGIVSESAYNGTEALELIRIRHARRTPFNLILVDLHMPGQNGIEVTRSIREIIGNETAVIILTAYSWDDIIDEALDAGVDSFLAKPLFSSTAIEEFTVAIRKKQAQAQKGIRTVSLTGRRILLAEDVEINAVIMKQLLEMRDMQVELAENGADAVELFAEHQAGYYDAILMDVRMPVMDGLTATARIRELEQTQNRTGSKAVPIIAMTANAFDEDVQRSLQAGMNAHLSKPVDPEHLFETLSVIIAQKSFE